MANELPTPDSTTPGTSPAAPGTSDQQADWQKQAGEWQKRFTGLQSKYQQEQQKWVADTGKLADYEANLTKVTGEREALALTYKSTQEALDAAKTESEVAIANLNRLKILTQPEYIDLLTFETKGLLPDGDGDELKAKLTEFKNVLTATGKAAVQQVSSSAPPPPPSPAPDKSLKEIDNQIYEALKNGDSAKYEELRKRRLALVAKK